CQGRARCCPPDPSAQTAPPERRLRPECPTQRPRRRRRRAPEWATGTLPASRESVPYGPRRGQRPARSDRPPSTPSRRQACATTDREGGAAGGPPGGGGGGGGTRPRDSS